MGQLSEPTIRSIKIVSPEGGSETVYAEQLGEVTFRLLENPIFSCHITYGTTVEVEEMQNGDLVVSKLIKASDFNTRRFLLSSSQSERFNNEVGDTILKTGGFWELAMGGLAFVSIPKNSTFDLIQFFKEIHFNPSEIIDDAKNGA